MMFVSVREPRMADRVVKQIRRMLIRGEIVEGTMLPSEAELMEQFGVSRSTLREALRVLESESLIEMQRGAHGGPRALRPQQATLARYAGLLMEFEGVTLKDVYFARAALETPMVEQLAREHNAKVIAELESMIERESRYVGGGGFDKLSEFHSAIAHLCGNRTLEIVNSMLHHVIAKANRSLQPIEGPRHEQAGRRAHKAHRMVLELIKEGDAVKAAQLWERHLKKAEEYVLTGAEMSTVVDLLD